MEAMIGVLLLGLIGALFLGPLGWRVWADRKRAEADKVAANIRAAVNRRLRGESYLAVRVTSRGLTGPGRIVLSTPGGYDWLVEQVWSAVVPHVPPGYELVVKPGSPRRQPAPEERPPLARAA